MAQGTQQQGTGEGQQGSLQNGQQLNQQQGRTFTQEEVNRIVQERLARVKGGADMSGLSDREKELNQKEIRLNAWEKLADAGIPKDLLPLVDCSSNENMEKSIKLIGTYFKGKGVSGGYRMSGGSIGRSVDPDNNADASASEIRAAMGLKGR